MFRSSLTIAILLCCCPAAMYGQNASNMLEPGYYVVVAAYGRSHESAAKLRTEQLNTAGMETRYGLQPSGSLYFVYLKYSSNLRDALLEMSKTRQESSFKDAWVKAISGKIASSPGEGNSLEQRPVDTSPPSTSNSGRPASKSEAADSLSVAIMNSRGETPPTSDADIDSLTDNPAIVQYKVMSLGNTDVFLSLFNGRNNRVVEGEVQVVDTDRARLIKRVKGNEYLGLPDPKSKSGQLTLICEAFGYRKIQQEINYPLPLADTVKPFIDLVGTTLVINFDLIRYYKGDIATLYNVYFYNDAALMLPESKYELNSLLELMNENAKYRIKLHGHSNGNYAGKILAIGDDKDLFSIAGGKETAGTAKDLSRYRAETIKQFLVTNGVDPSRIEVKAWGGRRPLFDRNGANAKRNVRVEVEILSD